jgi:LysM repeat protein
MTIRDLFKLAKLKIEAFTDEARQQPIAGKPFFEVQYNPETLSIRHESVFQDQQGIGTTSGSARFSHSRSKNLTVNLVLDGTHVGYFGVELLRHVPSVAEQLDDFLAICYQTQSSSHEPSYLKLSWGNGVLGKSFDCRLQSVDVKYTSFGRDGSPLHAELVAQFVEALDPKKKAAADGHNSPDLTHRRTVVAGDTLPLLCREIYGSAEYYLRVAEVNGLDEFRRLRPGQELVFPPFARSGS